MPISVRPKPFLPRGCPQGMYAGLALLSQGCTPDGGRLHTCYSPVRHSPAGGASSSPAAVRLACVKPAASVHPEPGSNSPLLVIYSYIYLQSFVRPAFLYFQDGISLTETPSKTRVPLSPLRLTSSVSAACLVASCHCTQSFSTGPAARSSEPAVGLFPDCGCKITTFFSPAQVFRRFFYALQHIFAITPYSATFSINVKIYFIVLTQ